MTTVPNPAAPTLSVRGLSVEFPSRHGLLVATRDISFDIQPGEILGMVGESGAGKSLTGMAVIGLLEPPGRLGGGEIHLAGRRIDNLPARARQQLRGKEIGAIFQDPLTSLHPLFTTTECRPPRPASARSNCCWRSAFRRRTVASTTIRTSSPAACASGW
jgi:peptide/nickel transport system ATP-binding protein